MRASRILPLARTSRCASVASGTRNPLRYDHLVSQLSDDAVSLPALGFAMGDVVLGEMIQEHPSAHEKMKAAARPKERIDVFIVIAKEERRRDALAHIQALRDENYRVDYPLSPAKVPKQFQAAEHAGAHFAILFGDEWPNVAVKNLATGQQQLVPAENLLAHLQSS